MFSGKTTELIRRVRRYRVAGLPVQLYKYAGDTRYDAVDMTSSHDGLKEVAIPIRSAKEARSHTNGIVAFDEGQFIEDIETVAWELAQKGIIVIVCALDTNFKREPFDRIQKLWFRADDRCQMHAICVDCKKDACFSQRTASGIAEELIGGADMYQAKCRQCFVEK